MEERKYDLLKFPLMVFKFSGLHPDSGKCILVTVTAICSIFLLIIIGVGCLHIFLAFEDPYLVLECVGYHAVYANAFAKLLIGVIKRHAIAKLIKDTKSFWDVSQSPSKVKDMSRFIFPIVMRLQKIFFYAIIATMSLAFLYAYLVQQLPYGLWLIKGHDVYHNILFYIQQGTITYTGITVIMVFDQFFLSLSVMLMVQFMFLNQRLKELSVIDDAGVEDSAYFLERLKLYIRYHDFLLRFSSDLAKTYSPLLLSVYVTMTIILCAAMLIVLESTDIAKVAFQWLVIFCSFTEILYYCILVDYVSDQASQVSFAIYSCDWHSKHVHGVKDLIITVIQRSQKEIRFSAGGLYEINSRSVLTMSKIAWSVCVATRSMKTINN